MLVVSCLVALAACSSGGDSPQARVKDLVIDQYSSVLEMDLPIDDPTFDADCVAKLVDELSDADARQILDAYSAWSDTGFDPAELPEYELSDAGERVVEQIQPECTNFG